MTATIPVNTGTSIQVSHRQARREEIERTRLSPRIREAALFYANVREGLDKNVVGHDDAKALMLLATASCRHMLLLAAPGTAKTRLGQSLALHLGLPWGELPCSADLQPSDATGWHFYNQATSAYEFVPGPLLNAIVQVDELNRALPSMHSGLLQAMENRRVTVDNKTYLVPAPGIMVATLNPVDHGTYPVPQSVLDRLLLNIHLSYLENPAEQHELMMHPGNYDEQIRPLGQDQALSRERQQAVHERAAQMLAFREAIRDEVTMEEAVASYIAGLFRYLRTNFNVDPGAMNDQHPLRDGGGGDRALVSLVAAAKAHALVCGARSWVEPDDVMAMAMPVLAHRLVLSGQLPDPAFTQAGAVIQEALARVPAPHALQASAPTRR
jgi:MoxR-like ATPase